MALFTATFHRVSAMPPLSWVGCFDFRSKTAEVQHGEWVEKGDDFLSEGVWSGEFGDPQIHETDCYFGTGFVIDGGTVIVVPSTATTDFCYYRLTDGMLVVSNSLPLLLARLHDELDPHNREYLAVNESIRHGIDAYHRSIPTRNGSVCRLMHNNLHVDQQGAREVAKPMPPHFHSFEEYRDYLVSNVDRLFRNARSPGRARPLQIFSTQSKGYDTTAINAIAAPFSIDRAFTCPETKEHRSYFTGGSAKSANANDDGSEICQILNIPCSYIDRRSVLGQSRLEMLFYAGLHHNPDFNLLDIFHHADRPTLLLTGVLGEMWYARKSVVDHRYDSTDQLKRWDLGGHSVGEVRLHTGVIQLPIPYIGARRRPELLQITESAEMAPWRLDNAYDRPIARRLAEEAGVPRESFGQKKMATVVSMQRPPFPFDAALRHQYQQFLTRERLLAPWQLKLTPVIHRFNNFFFRHKPQQYFVNSMKEVKSSRYPWRYFVGYGLNQCAKAVLRRPLKPRQLWTHLQATLYCFAVNEVAHHVYKNVDPTTTNEIGQNRESRITPDLSNVQANVNQS
jgi:hypothetical protein